MKKYFQDGSTYVWLTGVMASLSMLLVAGLLMLIFYYGFSTFWQNDVATIKLNDGSYISGEFKKEGKNYNNEDTVQLKIGNRDLYGLDFRWFNKKNIEQINYNKELLLIERNEWGVFYGFPKELSTENETIIYETDKNRFYQELEEKLNYKDFRSLSTPSDPNKGKIISRETGKPARFSSSSKIPKSSSTEFKSKYYYK